MNKAWDGAVTGMQAAEEHANRVHDDWSDLAYRFFECFVNNIGRSFLTEEVVKAAETEGVPVAPNNCAWGGIALRAKRNGIVVADGFGYSKLGKGHTKPMTLWKPIPTVQMREAA